MHSVTDLIDTTEMYLKTIFELDEEGITPLRARIAERLGHSGPTVSQTVARMERDGLIHLADDRQLQFTERGRTLATRVMRKHRLAERLLVDVIGLEWEFVHDEAFRAGVSTLLELAGDEPRLVRVRRIGETVQVDHEALSLLTVAGLLPGEQVAVRRHDNRIIAVRDGADEADGVSLPEGVATHVFAAAV